jgi:hypothetical protein
VRVGTTARCEAPDRPTRELEEHCYVLGDVVRQIGENLQRPDHDGDWDQAGEWLHLAAGVQRVDILTGRYDNSLVMCGSAMEYEDARSKDTSSLVTELTRLLFAWGAFETVISLIRPSGVERGKGQGGWTPPVAPV